MAAMKDRRFGAVVAALLALLVLGNAATAHAATSGSRAFANYFGDGDGKVLPMSVSPDAAPAGTKLTISSQAPCPEPASGETLYGVFIGIGTQDGFSGTDAQPRSDRSWTASVSLSAGLRNGGYEVIALCEAGPTADEAYPYAVYGSSVMVTSPAGVSDPVLRLAGTDRIGTAISVSQDLVHEKGYAAVLARADSYADAIAGAALAQQAGAPLLLTAGDSLDRRVEDELRRAVDDRDGEVAVLGGSAAISANVVDRLVTLGYSVTRYAGANRYDTAAKVAKDNFGEPTTILLADGNSFTDGLLASSAAPTAALENAASDPSSGGAAVLLTNGAVMPQETRDYLNSHGGVTLIAIGAAAAAAAPSATAITGADPAETSVRVAERFFPDPWAVGAASMANFPDALTGGAHVPRFGGPLLFTDPHTLSPVVDTYLQSHTRIPIGFVYGGPAAVGDAVLSAVIAAIT
jgi:putative cell wall-binding protein